MYDLKTITGQGSIGSRLKEPKEQARRVFLNLATQYNSNKMASEINKHFESNSEAIEVLIAVGNQLISVERIFTQKIAKSAIILELNGYSGCLEFG